MHPAHSVDNYIRIYTDANERKWVTHEELLLCGYRNISDFDIIYANDTFWELQAYIRAAKSWWIEEVQTGEKMLEMREQPPGDAVSISDS